MRSATTISIIRGSDTICTVPITESSRRIWKLMQEDSIVLEFTLKDAIDFSVGDYITDEVFGLFTITEEPVPAEYNNETGGYKYSLRFDRIYWMWKNQIFKLTAVDNASGLRKRVNSQWSLTDKLQTHVQELLFNLMVLDYPLHGFSIDGQNLITYSESTQTFDSTPLPTSERFTGVSAPDSNAYISYNGANIIKALEAMCDAYQCEWWVKDVTIEGVNNGEPFGLICLGKCEYGTTHTEFKMTPASGDYVDFLDNDSKDFMTGDTPTLDFHTSELVDGEGIINVEKMTVSRNEKEYGNRLLVYGSTKNIPDTYRKQLVFTSGQGVPMAKDITPMMYDGRFYSMDNTHATIYCDDQDANYKRTSAIPVHKGDVITCLLQGDYYSSNVHCVVCLFGVKSGDIVPDPYYTQQWDSFEKVVLLTGTDWDRGDYNTIQDFVIDDEEITYIFACTSRYNPGGGGWADEPFADIVKPVFVDADRKLSRAMLRSVGDISVEYSSFTLNLLQASPFNLVARADFSSFDVAKTDYYDIDFVLDAFININRSAFVSITGYYIYIDDNPVYSETLSTPQNIEGDEQINLFFSHTIRAKKLIQQSHTAYIKITGTFPLWMGVVKSSGVRASTIKTTSNEVYTAVKFNNNWYDVIVADWTDDYHGIAFVEEPPTGFGSGSVFSLREYKQSQESPSGILGYKVPSNYYTETAQSENDVVLIGEKRLMLPSGIPYIDANEVIPLEKLIEKVVLFDSIYPRCALRIIKVVGKEGVIKAEEYQDGTIKYENTANYFIAVKRVTKSSTTDAPFDFSEEMQLPGETLKVTFLTQDEEKEYTYGAQAYGDTTNGYKLSGLTFAVAYASFTDENGNRYKGFQIARNKDYGATFPSLSRFPMVGDTLFLSGWNARAMYELGLVDDAEAELMQAGLDYKDALEDNLFTFDCTMMSDWAEDSGILQFGQKSRVFHEAIKEKYKDSRIIGYELRLDIPYISPVYTIGETERYSRLRAIEKKLNAQERNSTASGAINAVAGGGCRSTGTLDWYNIKAGRDVNGKLLAIIENYTPSLEDFGTYKMFLLRWRKSAKRPRFASWHAPYLSHSETTAYNAIPVNDRAWPITGNKQLFFATTGHDYTDVLPLNTSVRLDGKYEFRNVHNRKMRFGCAIYKYTGVGTWGWQRVSNIAEIELFLKNDGTRMLSIRAK